MQTLIELAPLIVFFGVYKLAGGLYPATGALMVAMLLLLIYDWLRTRTLPRMHLGSAVLVWVFGTATLLLRDVRFIQWKATVFYWLVALVFAGSLFIGKTTLLERMLGKALPEGMTVSRSSWRNLSMVNAAFYFSLGLFNLWAAYRLTEATWVNLKTWLFTPLIFVFTAGVVFWLMRGNSAKEQT